MNYQKQVPQEVTDILRKRKVSFYDLDYYAYPQTFGSTSGPYGGIGGQSMSTFTIEAYVCDGAGPTVYLCSGMYYFEDKKFEPFKHIKNWSKI